MKEKIGSIAGKIWLILNENNEINLTQLPKIIDEKTPNIYQALGWLAREDKILYRTEGRKTLISLNHV